MRVDHSLAFKADILWEESLDLFELISCNVVWPIRHIFDYIFLGSASCIVPPSVSIILSDIFMSSGLLYLKFYRFLPVSIMIFLLCRFEVSIKFYLVLMDIFQKM